MSFDMYLTKHTFVGEYINGPRSDWDISIRQRGVAIINPDRVTSIRELIGSWSKDYQIGLWFEAAGCQPEVDNYVAEEQLQELLTTVRDVLADPSQAQDLLPWPEFYLSYRDDEDPYDEDYFGALRNTERILIEALKPDDNDVQFVYTCG
jgi:hypothetical protein